MSQQISTGIIGTGDFGTLFGHQLRDIESESVEAVADISAQNMDEAGETLEVPEESRYETHDELSADEPLDAVLSDWDDRTTSIVDSIVNGNPPPATARDALAVTALTEAAYESERSGKRVRVDIDGKPNELTAPRARRERSIPAVRSYTRDKTPAARNKTSTIY